MRIWRAFLFPNPGRDARIAQHSFSIYFWMPAYVSIQFQSFFGCSRTSASIPDFFLDAHVRQHPILIYFWMLKFASI